MVAPAPGDFFNAAAGGVMTGVDAYGAKLEAGVEFAEISLERLLCGREYGRFTSASPVQRALMQAIDGLPVSLPKERMNFHFGRDAMFKRRIPTVFIVRSGVRAAKSLIAIFAMLRSALTCKFRRPPEHDDEVPDEDGMVGVRPGELVRCLIVAPVLGLSRAPFHHLLGSMRASPKLSKLIHDSGKEFIEIRRPDGNIVRLELVAASSGGTNLRSTWLAGILFDEADFHDEEDASVNLIDNYRAVVPRMLPGAQIAIVSSPWADSGPFHELFTKGFGKVADEDGEDNCQLVFHSDTISMNPSIDRKAIARERARDPENAAREYDGIPLSSSSLRWFPPAVIAACCTREQKILPPNNQAHWAGTDLAFRKNSSALALSRFDEKVVLAFYDEMRPSKGMALKPSEVTDSFGKACMEYRAVSMMGDRIYADTAHDNLSKIKDPAGRTVAYEECDMGRPAQTAYFTQFLELMSEGLIEMPNDPRLIKQLEDTRKKKGIDGKINVVLPTHGAAHGDLLMAIVLSAIQVPADGSAATEDDSSAYVPNDTSGFREWEEDRGFG